MASTSEVYGDPERHPQREDYWGNVNPIGLRGCYDEAKRFAEAIVMAYHRSHKIDTQIIRIFNTYGERMRLDDGRVLPNFMGQALRGEPLTIYGDGSQTRSFCYVSDLVEGIDRLLRTDFHEPVNLGNPAEMTILQFAEEMLRLSGSKSTIDQSAAAAGRSARAPARHQPGPATARLGAARRPRRGAAPHARLLPGQNCRYSCAGNSLTLASSTRHTRIESWFRAAVRQRQTGRSSLGSLSSRRNPESLLLPP